MLHTCAGFFNGVCMFGILVEFIDVLEAVLDHFVHGNVLGEFTINEAIAAIVAVFALVGVGAELFRLGHGHAAALAKWGVHIVWGLVLRWFIVSVRRI